MVRIDSVVLANIYKDIQDGASLNLISKKYSVNKSTLYYHYKHIKGKKFAKPFTTPNFTELEGEIVGLFTGDGSQHYVRKDGHYQVNIHFGVHAREYAEYVQQLLLTYFQKKFILYQHDNKIRLRTNSKDIFYYFHNYLLYDSRKKHSTVKLHTLNVPRAFKIGFLRGIVDTDGMVKYRKERNRIRVFFYTTSFELHKQCHELLVEFGMSHGTHRALKKKTKTLYIIQLHQTSVIPFLNLVHPFKRLYIEKYIV